ncbi:MAG: hypothetical protein EOO38_20510, partial [Cytophagaceae bacterium]
EVQNGIVVDAFGRTNDPAVFAMGDAPTQLTLLDQEKRTRQYSTVQIGERPYDYGYSIATLLSAILVQPGMPIAPVQRIGYDVCRSDNAFECNGRITALQ